MANSDKVKLEFFMPMAKVPTCTHQEKQVRILNGKPIFYEPSELKEARAKLMAYLGKYAPKKKMSGPIQLHVKWCFPITGRHRNGEYKITKPDTDNLQKLLKDVMTILHFWNDDAQVVLEIVEKFYAEVPGIWIHVEEIENG